MIAWGYNVDTKKCRRCKVPKLHFDFGLDGRVNGGRRTICRECINKQTKKRKEATPKKTAAAGSFFLIDFDCAPHNQLIKKWKGYKAYPCVCLLPINKIINY